MFKYKISVNLKKLFSVMGIAFFFFINSLTIAQEKIISLDSSQVKKTAIDTLHSPKRAMILSAMLPGTGQIYNKKYWKAPMIYGGFVALGMTIAYNHKQFLLFKDEYIFRKLNSDFKNMDLYNYPTEGNYSLNEYQEMHRLYRDISIIATSVFYLFNIIDAGVDAHMLTFNIDEDLTLTFQPSLINFNQTTLPTSGLSCRINF